MTAETAKYELPECRECGLDRSCRACAAEDALFEALQGLDRLQINRDSIIDLQQQVTQQAATISQLRGWVELYSEHRATCTYEWGACDCGLDAALASLPE